MALKFKELNDDALIDIKVNKAYYMMVKNSLFYLLNEIKEDENKETLIKNTTSIKYEEMTDWQRIFHTLTLLIAEIEKQAKDKKLYTEKEILEPNDEGYVAPSQD